MNALMSWSRSVIVVLQGVEYDHGLVCGVPACPGCELFVCQGVACLGVYPVVWCGDTHEDVVPEAYDSAGDRVVCVHVFSFHRRYSYLSRQSLGVQGVRRRG